MHKQGNDDLHEQRSECGVTCSYRAAHRLSYNEFKL